MAPIALRHILGGQTDARPVLTAMVEAFGAPLSVEDSRGRMLFGDHSNGHGVPVVFDGHQLGTVSGRAGAALAAALLTFLAEQEAGRKSMGAEVLHLYREVNLIYSFSEKLAALLDTAKVAELTLQEARHLITATDAALMLMDEGSGALDLVAAFGDQMPRLSGFTRGHGIVGAVAEHGIGEIVNDVSADHRRVSTTVHVESLVCAPLKVGEKVIGVIVLASTEPRTYEARDLKLLNTLALQAATAIENARLFERTIEAAQERERLMALHQEAEIARAGFERELELAANIQANLFPAELPRITGYELAARNRPARRCGGDYYDAISTRNGDGMLLCVADVSGKGVPASLLMSHMQATLRALLGWTTSLTDVVDQASRLLHGSTAANKYVTAAMLDLTPATGQGRYVSAGHINSWVFDRDGRSQPLASTGAPLGLLPPLAPYADTPIEIRPGDCVVLCSDGVTDAQNEASEEFGEDRLIEVLRGCADAPVAAIVDRVFNAVDSFAGRAPQFDDITLLVVRREG
jgi:sigma-B regulation protein RsbU (phosphoserine phosphatase)